jgi:SpoIID/LytB domain protein
VYEEFENCWEDKHYRYLESRSDSEDEQTFPDLTVEQNARQWIMTRPKSFCNTTDAHTLSQVLNNYDQETQDFYRWTVNYSQSELSAIIRDRSGIDFGDIIDLQPVERGTSGRLIKLRIVGTKKKLVIGKELEIRRTLSRSHLYSSAFLIERTFGSNAEVPTSFTLRGAGWGHGVGLCQIGAAVMGANGYDYRQILSHYFLDSDIKKVY